VLDGVVCECGIFAAAKVRQQGKGGHGQRDSN
jgi:hypothetical protein